MSWDFMLGYFLGTVVQADRDRVLNNPRIGEEKLIERSPKQPVRLQWKSLYPVYTIPGRKERFSKTDHCQYPAPGRYKGDGSGKDKS